MWWFCAILLLVFSACYLPYLLSILKRNISCHYIGFTVLIQLLQNIKSKTQLPSKSQDKELRKQCFENTIQRCWELVYRCLLFQYRSVAQHKFCRYLSQPSVLYGSSVSVVNLPHWPLDKMGYIIHQVRNKG